tara:strand:+ start:828 stop:965 length:138 start_codon:yes stop_codon:yes gene_type:complete
MSVCVNERMKSVYEMKEYEWKNVKESNRTRRQGRNDEKEIILPLP